MQIYWLVVVGAISGAGAGLLAGLIGIGGGIVVVPVVYYGLIASGASADQARRCAASALHPRLMPLWTGQPLAYPTVQKNRSRRSCPQSPGASRRNQCAFGRSVAAFAGACHVWPDPDLPVRPEPRRTAMAMDNLGQCLCRHCMARRVGTVLLVLGPFWELQQDLRFARSRHRIYDLDVAVDNRGFDWCKLNAEIEHQTARDRTTGRPKPLGVRAAKMADTIGPAQA